MSGLQEQAPVTAPETSAVVSNVEPAAKTEPQNTDAALDAKISEIWKKHETADASATPKASDEPAEEADKKAADADQSDETTIKKTEKTDEQAPKEAAKETDPSATPLPRAWAADRQKIWDSIPLEGQKYIEQRETEFSRKLTEQGRIIKSYEPISKVMRDWKGEFDLLKMPPQQAIHNLLEYNKYLRENPVEAISNLAASLGVDIRKIADGQTDEELGVKSPAKDDPTVAGLKSQVASLTSELNSIKSGLTQEKRQQHDRENGERLRSFDEFVKDKDETELQAVQEEFLAMTQAIRSANPGLSDKEVLAQAYEKAVYANPTTRAKRLADDEAKKAREKAETQNKAAKEKASSGAINVKTQVPNPAKPKTEDEAMKIVWDRHHANT